MTRRARWVVRPGDGGLEDVLAKMGVPASAIAAGGVFIGRTRVRRADERVAPGDEVRASWSDAAARPPPAILFERRGVVAVVKPAGIPTIPDVRSGDSLLADVARALDRPRERVHTTSRLDRGVSGVVLFTIDKGAADRLARARAEARYARRYVALASAAVTPERGEWEAPIGRAADPRHRAAFGRDAAPALTRYVQIARIEAGGALLALEPVTGRTHQLRVHAAHAGAPLLGDATYGGPRRVVLASGSVLALDRVALHCARVEIEGEELCALAPVPGDLADFGRALGVDAALWERAITPSRSAR